MRYTLLLVHSWPSSENPAASQFIYQDALILNQIVDLNIILISNSNENWNVSGFKNFTVINYQASLNLKNITYVYKGIQEYIEKDNDEKIYLVTALPETSFIGFLVKNHFKFWFHFEHSILTSNDKKIRNHYFPKKQQNLKQLIKNLVYKSILHYPHRITVPSQYLANNFAIKSKKIEIIPNHINIDQIQILQNGKYKKNNKSAVFIGSLNSGKDPILAIKIFEHLKKKGIVNDFKIYGEGELRDTLLEIKKGSEFSNDIEIHGFVNPDEITEILAKSNYLILPTKFETFGITILSALISETIIITSGVGGHLELLEGKQYVYINESHDFEDQLIAQIIHVDANKIAHQAKSVPPGFTERQKKMNYTNLFNY
jgi:glycosyltransferase involved in cell wall biosynthesis